MTVVIGRFVMADTWKTYCRVSGTLFAIVAAAHLLRIVNGLPVVVGGYDVPMVASWIGFLVPAGLAAWAFRAAGRAGD